MSSPSGHWGSIQVMLALCYPRWQSPHRGIHCVTGETVRQAVLRPGDPPPRASLSFFGPLPASSNASPCPGLPAFPLEAASSPVLPLPLKPWLGGWGSPILSPDVTVAKLSVLSIVFPSGVMFSGSHFLFSALVVEIYWFPETLKSVSHPAIYDRVP